MTDYFINTPALDVRNMLSQVIKRDREKSIINMLLPEQNNPQNLSFEYPVYNYETSALPPRPSPPGTDPIRTEGFYNVVTVTAIPWRYGGEITEWNKWLIVDATRDLLETLTDNLVEKEQEEVFDHLLDTTRYPDINTAAIGAGVKWDDVTNGNPIQDILDMKRDIKKASKEMPDILVMNSDVSAILMGRPDVRKLIGDPHLTTTVQANGILDRLLGFDVIVSDPISRNQVTAAETFKLSDTVIMMKSGRRTGIVHVAEPYTVTKDPVRNRAQTIEVYKTFIPHIWREKNVGNMTDVLT